MICSVTGTIRIDRKSTRLNSSHLEISYAVFCLKKKLTYKPTDPMNNLIAAWHIYEFNPCNTVSCYDGAPAAVVAQVPLVATELGSHACDATFLNGAMNWLDSKQSSYFPSAWDTWGSARSTDALISN